ncbi:MAG TPA: phosphatidylserine/phosphatidylglycerophosphate/cardiolipin synthase family protein [Thermoanaerobaculia bacterium]|nr:phosphatidylserine/phosphatidylglycerophosphate/cardiolipin synthase family protein [Thermoanaerobaculia bacterium]
MQHLPPVRARLAFVFVLAVASTVQADVFRVLDDDREAVQARVDIIQQSEREVHALYFLARNDRITLGALALLIEARRRGVPSVKLVVDANFSHIPKAVLAHLRDEGVEVRVYHPITLRHPSWLFRRMHEKVVVVDGERYIAGGRNLAEAYFGMARKNYVDRDVYVEGASAANADTHFEKVWTSKHVAVLDVHVPARRKEQAKETLTHALEELQAAGIVTLNTGQNWSDGQRDVGEVRFLHDPLVPGKGERVGAQLAKLLEGAKESIVIESPYLVPSRPLRELLQRKVTEGVSVTVLTNSLRSCDGILPQAGYLKYRGRLVRAGIDVREYKGPNMLHAKSAVIDGRIVVVGSYNLDQRSQNLDSEVVCITEDEEVARQVLASIDGHIENAWVIRGSRLPRLSLRVWAAKVLFVPLFEPQL